MEAPLLNIKAHSVGRFYNTSARRRGVEQAEQLQLLLRGQKRRLKRIPRQLPQMLVGKSKRLLSELVFPRERGSEQRRIVGIERDHHALIEIILRRMLRRRLADSGAQ